MVTQFFFDNGLLPFEIVSFKILVELTDFPCVFRGDLHPALWGAKVGNSWRTTNDIADTWER